MPPRRKARKGSAQNSASDAEGQVESVAALNTTHDNTVRRNLRGRRGGLRDMPNMPLDVLIEVSINPSGVFNHGVLTGADLHGHAPARLTEPCTHKQASPRAPH